MVVTIVKLGIAHGIINEIPNQVQNDNTPTIVAKGECVTSEN